MAKNPNPLIELKTANGPRWVRLNETKRRPNPNRRIKHRPQNYAGHLAAGGNIGTTIYEINCDCCGVPVETKNVYTRYCAKHSYEDLLKQNGITTGMRLAKYKEKDRAGSNPRKPV